MTKASYFIAERKGFKAVKGYVFDVVYGDNKYKMGVRQDETKSWNIDILANGFALVEGMKTKKEAVASITYELMDKFESLLENPNAIKRAEMLQEYLTEHALELE